MSCRRVSWSGLPPELLTLIAERLGTRIDTFNFRLVCKKWRSSTSFCVHHPQNHLSPIFPFEFSFSECDFAPQSSSPITIVASSVFLIQTSLNSIVNPWLCTVEELSPGRLCLRRPTSYCCIRKSSPIVPDNLNLALFKVKEVLRFYTISSSCGMLKLYGGRLSVSKVFLIADPNCKTNPKIDDYNAIVLIDNGTLHLISIKHRRIDRITGPYYRMYDDVVNFKGSIFAIDRKGRAYTMAYNSTRLHTIVPQPVGEGSGTDRKKRLVESCNGELYLVHRCPPYLKGIFKLYKLNEETYSWDEAEEIGDDRILIVTCDGCFFVETKDFPGWRGNCIVFRKGHFPAYNGASVPDLEIFGTSRDFSSKCDIAVFHFDEGDCKPGFSGLFWPPPVWLSSDTHLFNSASIGEMEIIRDFYNIIASEPTKEVETSEAMLAVKDKHEAKQGPIIIDIDSFPETTPKAGENVVAQATFQGINVCSNLVPILEKIWDKYGNIIQEHVVSSNSLLTWALESLAKMVIILQTNSTEPLNDSQPTFLSATLKDLQHLHIRLDWLLPFLEKVLAPKNSEQQD